MNSQPSISNCFQHSISMEENSVEVHAPTYMTLVQNGETEDIERMLNEQTINGAEALSNIDAYLSDVRCAHHEREDRNDTTLPEAKVEEEELNSQNEENKSIAEVHSKFSVASTHQKHKGKTTVNKNLLLCNQRQNTHGMSEFPLDITNFLEVMYDLLECPVCWNHMVPPILMCESGHNICFKCRPFMTKCPLCRKAFLQTRNVALETVARKLGLACNHEDCHKRCLGLKENHENHESVNQITYACPLTLYTHCYWLGNYSDIRNHIEEIHASKMLVQGRLPVWELKLVVRDSKVIFALDEIFFYRERLDTSISKFYIQVFYVGEQENHNRFSYHLEISSGTRQQKLTIHNRTLPINDLEQTYTYSSSHCTVLDYQTVSEMSKHGDLKCILSLERCLGND